MITCARNYTYLRRINGTAIYSLHVGGFDGFY